MKAIGLMSGTSMDGLDCGLFHINLSSDFQFSWKCEAFQIVPYSTKLRKLIRKAVIHDGSANNMVHNELGKVFLQSVKKLGNYSIDLIVSHGQTVSHNDGVSTKQIGSLKYLQKKYNVPIIYNLRQADIDAGGNGAPLMPFLDWLLFKNSNVDTITLNLGGVANISFIPKSGERNQVIGFDTGPGMALIDETTSLLLNKNMDKDGTLAKKGIINKKLLNELMKNKFILKNPPKSTGRHEFGNKFVKEIRKKYAEMSVEDLLRTFSIFTAKSIAINVKKNININLKTSRMIISGGGVYHPVLMSDIKSNLDMIDIKTTVDFGIDPKMKESLLMAVLGVARIHKFSSNMPNVTGASNEIILGDCYKIKN